MAPDQEAVADGKGEVSEDISHVELDALHLFEVVRVCLHDTAGALGTRRETHVDEIVIVTDGVETACACFDDLNWLCDLASVLFDLVDLDGLAHHGALDNQLEVGEEANVLQHPHRWELDKTVRGCEFLGEVVELLSLLILLGELLPNCVVLCSLLIDVTLVF